jgi:hypothetical protein
MHFTNRSLLLLAALASFCGSGCLGASEASAFKDGEKARINWDGAAARICVTEPSVECPAGKDDVISSGRVYWVLDATCFPGGIDKPIEYGVQPKCSKDVTAANNGKTIPMEPGVEYKVTIAGFGGSATVTTLRF